MNNVEKIVLKNGLKIYLIKDNTKNRTSAYLYTLVGGKDTTFYIDGKKCSVKAGTAHFLEHYLIEHSIYGNVLKVFDDNYVDSNGITSLFRTFYYISTVHDFEEMLVKLLNIVNNPIFDQKNIDDTKMPIISEIDRKNDKKYLYYSKTINEAMYKYSFFNKNLGEKNDILNMDVDNLKLFHKAFYRADNQVLVISGNIKNNIIDLVEKTYSEFNFDNRKVEKEVINEPNEVIKKYVEYRGNIKDESFTIGIKISSENLSPLEKNKFDYYLTFITEYNFNEKSKLYKELLNDNLITYSFRINQNIFNGFFEVYFENISSNFDIIVEKVKNKLNNLEFDKEKFEIWKNRMIMYRINDLESIDWKRNNFTNNLFDFDLESFDDLDFIKSFDFDECKKMISSVDFNNYSILKNIVE